MSSCYKKSIIVFLLILSIAPLVSGQTDCSLKKQKEDLKVYTCSTDDSNLKILKVELILKNTSFKELMDFVDDINNYVNWQYNTKEATILQTREKSVIYRTVVEAPWPLSSREMIIEHSSTFDSAKQVLTINSQTVPYDFPVDEDLVRVSHSIASWNVSALNNSLKIEYILRIDPGGSVPGWLVNVAMADGPYNSFIRLKEELEHKHP